MELFTETSFVKHDSCEPLLSVITFGIIINIYRFLDQFCPSMHKYKLNYSPNNPPSADKFLRFGREFVK